MSVHLARLVWSWVVRPVILPLAHSSLPYRPEPNRRWRECDTRGSRETRPFLGTVSIPFRRPTAGPEGVTERRETARGREKIPREGEFTLRTDPWAGLIASIGSFYLMVYPLPLSARGSVVHPSLPHLSPPSAHGTNRVRREGETGE